jgi:choline dehydrogenase
VTLKSKNPLEAPLINPNILGSEIDMFFMREALRASLRFAAAPAWAGYVIEPVHFNSSSTDAQLDAFLRSNAGTVFHPVGTAAMSPKTAKYGVVNPDLLVKGVSGLRIVDLSVLVRPLACLWFNALNRIHTAVHSCCAYTGRRVHYR